MIYVQTINDHPHASFNEALLNQDTMLFDVLHFEKIARSGMIHKCNFIVYNKNTYILYLYTLTQDLFFLGRSVGRASRFE